jgi:hypothetical protein
LFRLDLGQDLFVNSYPSELFLLFTTTVWGDTLINEGGGA